MRLWCNLHIQLLKVSLSHVKRRWQVIHEINVLRVLSMQKSSQVHLISLRRLVYLILMRVELAQGLDHSGSGRSHIDDGALSGLVFHFLENESCHVSYGIDISIDHLTDVPVFHGLERALVQFSEVINEH